MSNFEDIWMRFAFDYSQQILENYPLHHAKPVGDKAANMNEKIKERLSVYKLSYEKSFMKRFNRYKKDYSLPVMICFMIIRENLSNVAASHEPSFKKISLRSS